MADTPRSDAARLLDRWPRFALVLGVVVLANVLAHVVVIRPTVQTSGDREAILDGARQRLAEASARLDAIERTASKHACTRSDVDFVFEEVLSSKGARMTAVQRELRKLARDNRLDPARVSYSFTPVGASGLVQFTCTFPLDGPYEMLRNFIAQVESSPNFLVVQDVALTGDRTQAGGLRLQVSVATYFVDPDLARLQAAFPRMGRGRS